MKVTPALLEQFVGIVVARDPVENFSVRWSPPDGIEDGPELILGEQVVSKGLDAGADQLLELVVVLPAVIVRMVDDFLPYLGFRLIIRVQRIELLPQPSENSPALGAQALV